MVPCGWGGPHAMSTRVWTSAETASSPLPASRRTTRSGRACSSSLSMSSRCVCVFRHKYPHTQAGGQPAQASPAAGPSARIPVSIRLVHLSVCMSVDRQARPSSWAAFSYLTSYRTLAPSLHHHSPTLLTPSSSAGTGMAQCPSQFFHAKHGTHPMIASLAGQGGLYSWRSDVREQISCLFDVHLNCTYAQVRSLHVYLIRAGADHLPVRSSSELHVCAGMIDSILL